jgi:hypothetical protein
MNANAGQSETAESDLVEVSKAWSNAFYEGNTNELDNLEQADLIVVDGGVVWQKAEPRASSSFPKLTIKTFTKEFFKVDLPGEFGFLLGKLVVDDGIPLLFTEYWKKQNDRWLVSAAHFSQQR